MIEELRFREVMGHFATGVTIVGARSPEGVPVGLTVNAFTSVSLNPPLVLVCIHRLAESHDPLIRSGYFAVSVLTREQDALAWRFSAGEAETRFVGLESWDCPMGSPRFPGALAWLECSVRDVHPAGDHSIIVGEVLSCDDGQGEPLLFFRGRLGMEGP
jgi:3-hydroxy-9,10-secoandrosta-1,3,5(10)-triene-9,17-dione monooxygenase reductase component